MITFLILTLIALGLLSIVFWSIKNGISPMPSTPQVKVTTLNLIKEISFEGDIYELGAGWGTMAFALAKEFPQHKIVAIENSTIPFAICKLRQLLSPRPNLEFHKMDFFKFPLKNAGVVFCYLYPGAMVKLKEKFEKDLDHKSWVISSTFAIPGRKPFKETRLNDLYRTKIYVYLYDN